MRQPPINTDLMTNMGHIAPVWQEWFRDVSNELSRSQKENEQLTELVKILVTKKGK